MAPTVDRPPRCIDDVDRTALTFALSLKNAEVDLKTGMLSIHLTKFGKSHQVPVHPSTLEALRQYRLRRDLVGESCGDDTRSSSAAGGDCTACHWVTARCIAVGADRKLSHL